MKTIKHYHEGCEQEIKRGHCVYQLSIKYYKISREHSDEKHVHYFACTNEEMLVHLMQALIIDMLEIEKIEIKRV